MEFYFVTTKEREKKNDFVIVITTEKKVMSNILILQGLKMFVRYVCATCALRKDFYHISQLLTNIEKPPKHKASRVIPTFLKNAKYYLFENYKAYKINTFRPICVLRVFYINRLTAFMKKGFGQILASGKGSSILIIGNGVVHSSIHS